MSAQAKEHKGVRLLDECPMHPEDGERHECMRKEMRCTYCGVRLDPYPCNGCGKFLTAEEMSGEGLCADGTRCDGCA
jgi:hypothetical protein